MKNIVIKIWHGLINMKEKIWITIWFTLSFSIVMFISAEVYKVDPFFHYHKPNISRYYYEISNERSQNDGILKHFDFDAMIVGTSMTENFRTTEMNDIFGCNAVKTPFSGGSYKEINDHIETALKHNNNLKIVVRALDMDRFFDKWDNMRDDLGTYPTYLYDDNPFNDVRYYLNRDIVFSWVYKMISDKKKESFEPGISSFDGYARWQGGYTFGIDTVCPDGIYISNSEMEESLTEEEKGDIKENIKRNVTELADRYPNVDFYYFYSPYSIAWWREILDKGEFEKRLEAEKFITELILPHKNIHLYSFNNRTDIITDLNHYKDNAHYACWINSLMLKWMHDGEGLLSEDNYEDYLKQERKFYSTFDYEGLNGQEDYEADFYAAALLNHELTGAEPVNVMLDRKTDVRLRDAEKIIYEGENAIKCDSMYENEPSDDQNAFIKFSEYKGIKFSFDMDKGYKGHGYLSFCGQKLSESENGEMRVFVVDSSGNIVAEKNVEYQDMDEERHQYVLDLSTISGQVTVVLGAGEAPAPPEEDSKAKRKKKLNVKNEAKETGFLFSDICFY